MHVISVACRRILLGKLHFKCVLCIYILFLQVVFSTAIVGAIDEKLPDMPSNGCAKTMHCHAGYINKRIGTIVINIMGFKFTMVLPKYCMKNIDWSHFAEVSIRHRRLNHHWNLLSFWPTFISSQRRITLPWIRRIAICIFAVIVRHFLCVLKIFLSHMLRFLRQLVHILSAGWIPWTTIAIKYGMDITQVLNWHVASMDMVEQGLW